MATAFDLNNSKYVKLEYKNSVGEISAIKTSIKDIQPQALVLCCEYKSEVEIKYPQDVVLKFACEEGLYVSSSVLKKIVQTAGQYVFIVTLPKDFEYRQKREYFRIYTAANCLLEYKTDDTEKQIKVQTYDISANGVSVFLPFKTIEEDVTLILTLGTKEIITPVRYIRSEKIDDKYLVSFSYEELSEKNRDIISKFCIQKQLEKRKKH